MANEMYRCPLCPKDAPELELDGTKSQSVFEWPDIGLVITLTAKLADGTTHAHGVDA